MNKISKRVRVLILLVLLFIISTMVICINGKTYTVKITRNMDEVEDGDDLIVQIEDENIVRCVDKRIENGALLLKFEAVSEGKTFIDIVKSRSAESSFWYMASIFVHKFGIITFDNYFGDSNGSIVIPISITILLAYILYLLIEKYRKNMQENIYQYKNIGYLGIIIFLCFALINQLLMMINYTGILHTIEGTISLCYTFSYILLPIAFVTSILVTISNIFLIKKEGFSFKNILGLILGVFFCFTTLIPNLLNDILQSATWVDVHNQQAIPLYIQKFVEFAIYLIVSYIECILIAAIVLGIKAAKRIPKLDKDFILILGCKLRKDGTLTNLLKGRVDKAIEFRNIQKDKMGKDLIFVPSGGKGSDEVIPEALAIKNYLIEKGIKEENILVEDKSKNTFENIKFSNELITEKMKDAKIAFSTTNYHVFRAGITATDQNISVEGIGAKTKSYFGINAFIREFIATIVSEKKKHIGIICGILFVAVFMIGLLYLSNVI